MGNELSGLWKTLVKARRGKASWLRLVSLLSAGALFCTVYVLMLPARTLSPEPVCGLEEHTHGPECYETRTVSVLSCSPETLGLHVHSDSCYDSQGNLCCGQADFVLHTHDEGCYDENGRLVCGLPEIREHIHGPECYRYENQLICTEEEYPAHTHGPECYTRVPGKLICGEEEYPAHTHGPECYETRQVLACDLDHEHTEDCYVTEKTLVCTLREGPGHTHTDACYEWHEELTCGLKEGPGHTHGPECYQQVPVLICGQPEIIAHTHDESCYDQSGNCICGLPEVKVHVHNESCYRQQEQQVLVCGLEEHTHTDACYPEPENGSSPGENGPAEPVLPGRTLTARLQGITVTVTGQLPEEVALQAEPVPVELPELSVLMALDIQLILPDGSHYEPEGQEFSVTITAPEIGEEAPEVYALPPEGQPEPVPARIRPGSADFVTDHLSIYVLTREAPQRLEPTLLKTALDPLPTRAGEPISYRLELSTADGRSFTGEPGAVYMLRDDLGPDHYLTMEEIQSLLLEADSRGLDLEIRVRDALVSPDQSETVYEEPHITKTTANSCRGREVLSDLVITLEEGSGQQFRVRAEDMDLDMPASDLRQAIEDGLGYGVTDTSRYILTWTLRPNYPAEEPVSFRLDGDEPLTITYLACIKDPIMALTRDQTRIDRTVSAQSSARLDRIFSGETATIAETETEPVTVSCNADFSMEVSRLEGRGWEPVTEGFCLAPEQPVRVRLEPGLPGNIPTQNYPTVLHASGSLSLLIPEDKNPGYDHCRTRTLSGQTYRVLCEPGQYEVYLSAPGYEGVQKARVVLDSGRISVKFYPTAPGGAVTGNLVLQPGEGSEGAIRLCGFYNDRHGPEADPALPGSTRSRRLYSDLSGRCSPLGTDLQILSTRGSTPDQDLPVTGDSSPLTQGQSVTYRVTLENRSDSDLTVSGGDLQLLLPAAGAFRWELGSNVTAPELTCSQMGGDLLHPENWLVEDCSTDPADTLFGRQRLILRTDAGLNLPGHAAAWLYVTLTFPEGDSWTAFLDSLADPRTDLALMASGSTRRVFHDLIRPDIRPAAADGEQRVVDLQDPEHFACSRDGGTLILPMGSTGAGYELEVTNLGDTPMTGLTIIDVLPRAGDTGLLVPELPGNSGFDLTLDPERPITVTVTDCRGSAETLSPSQYTLTFSSRSSFPAQGPDWTGAEAAHWTADPAAAEPLRAIRVQIQSPVEIPPEGTVTVRFAVQLPEYPTGTAYNSFGFHCSLNDPDQEPETVSGPVGLKVERLSWALQIRKADSTAPDRPLSDARFALYTQVPEEAMEDQTYETLEQKPERTSMEGDTTWYLCAVGATGPDGMLTLPDLVSPEYRLQEYQAPPGYLTSGSLMPVKAPEPGQLPAVLEITNAPGFRLPNTGGTGSQTFYLTGLGLMALAILGLLSRKRRGGMIQ